MIRNPNLYFCRVCAFDQDYFRGDDGKVKFYTRLPSFEVLTLKRRLMNQFCPL